MKSGWKNGPLPPNTYNWGGVVVKGEKPEYGFHFADFCGDHVKLCPEGTRVEAENVAQYNNSIELPSGCENRAGCEPPS